LRIKAKILAIEKKVDDETINNIFCNAKKNTMGRKKADSGRLGALK
jgi:hypothetical protein